MHGIGSLHLIGGRSGDIPQFWLQEIDKGAIVL